MSTAAAARPDDDPDKDGKTNLEEYLAQTDPTLGTPKLEMKIGKENRDDGDIGDELEDE